MDEECIDKLGVYNIGLSYYHSGYLRKHALAEQHGRMPAIPRFRGAANLCRWHSGHFRDSEVGQALKLLEARMIHLKQELGRSAGANHKSVNADQKYPWRLMGSPSDQHSGGVDSNASPPSAAASAAVPRVSPEVQHARNHAEYRCLQRLYTFDTVTVADLRSTFVRHITREGTDKPRCGAQDLEAIEMELSRAGAQPASLTHTQRLRAHYCACVGRAALACP